MPVGKALKRSFFFLAIENMFYFFSPKNVIAREILCTPTPTVVVGVDIRVGHGTFFSFATSNNM